MRFDAYAATIQEHPIELVQYLAHGLHGQPRSTRGMHGYTQGWEIASTGSGDVLARVLAGGRNPHPHAWAQGDATEQFVQLVRDGYQGRHHVTRMDACEDFDAPGAYEILRTTVRDIITPRGIKGREIVPEDIDEGRTFYAGSPKSDVRLRLYEKGKQLRAQAPAEALEEISPNLVRLEPQVRPQKESRKAAAYCTPAQVFGFSAWTHDLALKALELDVQRVQTKPWREPDDERAFRHMLRMYGPLLERLQADFGSWCVVGKTIGEAIERRKATPTR